MSTQDTTSKSKVTEGKTFVTYGREWSSSEVVCLASLHIQLEYWAYIHESLETPLFNRN